MSDASNCAGELLAQRYEPGGAVLVELVQSRPDALRPAPCRRVPSRCGPLLHSSDDVDESPAGLAPRRVPVELQRDPHIVVVIHKPKSRRHHADDLCRSIVQLDKAADDTSIAAEPRLPQAMADDGHIGRIRAIVVFVDRAAEDRFNTEHWKELRRDRLQGQSRRFTRACQDRRASGRPCRDAFERAVVALPIEPVRRRDRVVTVAAPRLVHHDQVSPSGYGSGRSSS